MSKAPDLSTAEEAKEILHMSDADFATAVEDGTLRRVRHADGAFILGVDVDKALRDADPRHLARPAPASRWAVSGARVSGRDRLARAGV